MSFYKPDIRYRAVASLVKAQNAEPFEMSTYSGKTKTFKKWADAYFTIEGQDHKLTIYQNLLLVKMDAYKNLLFLPFVDLTSGVETYGGGRYIDLDIRDELGDKIVIDFNKCYNPWCAYKDGYNCPIPPAGNHLSVKIEAGELKYPKELK